MLIQKLMEMNGVHCLCGKKHTFESKIITGRGVIDTIPEIVMEFNAKKPYVLVDKNTYLAAGKDLCDILSKKGIKYTLFSFGDGIVEPDEKNVGSAFMHMTAENDMVIAVGSGVINDIAKIVSARSRFPYVIVATAPSMDGYASKTSSVTLDGIKVSLPSKCADVIVGDINIIKTAPKEMLLAGIGDMIAKYISICEWRIASLLVGEYYCERIAELVRTALKRTVELAPLSLEGDEEAISAIFDALIIGSVAMNYAGLSRPASGVEHYISHLYDTRGVEFGEKTAFHGIQCAISTLIASRLYEKVRLIKPDREKALRYVEAFDNEEWNERLKSLLGKSADSIIELEKTEGKYDKEKHKARLEIIIDKWDEIINIIDEEVPYSEHVEKLMLSLGIPTDFKEAGMNRDLLPEIFCATKDIRDKYVLSRLLWDLGVIDEFAKDV